MRYYKDGSITNESTKEGILHRVDGPAVERSNGDKEWYLNGKLHRINGPALIHSNGFRWWYLDGRNYHEEQFNQLIREAKALPPALRLTDPREWVRKIGERI